MYDRRLQQHGDTIGPGAGSSGGVEHDFAHNFRGGEFTGGRRDQVRVAGVDGDSFGGAGLMGQLEKNVAEEARLAASRSTGIVEQGYSLSHSEGFEVRSYFLVFVPTIREMRDFYIERCNALIEKVSPCIGLDEKQSASWPGHDRR
eukprot:SAG31_NODE_1103_length_9895_cov_13.722540_6_plen_146_part_00